MRVTIVREGKMQEMDVSAEEAQRMGIDVRDENDGLDGLRSAVHKTVDEMHDFRQSFEAKNGREANIKDWAIHKNGPIIGRLLTLGMKK